MLGTIVEVISADKFAPDVVFSEIKRIEALLSKYDPKSEISKLNKTGSLTVSDETFYVLNKAKEFWIISNGAFDVTVGPLMDLWGFTNKRYIIPKGEQIDETLKLVGMDKIILNANNNVVKFKLPGIKIDLGAIAKGYALDCAVKKLREAGIKSCLINAGGQVYCLGERFSKPWKVAIKNPAGSAKLGELELRNKSVATSGDYEQYFFNNKNRYCHIFNPKTGNPVETDLASVTVISDSGLISDALATAIFVLGKVEGKKLAQQFPNTQIKIFEKGDVRGS